jgi:hypothetical protein
MELTYLFQMVVLGGVACYGSVIYQDILWL